MKNNKKSGFTLIELLVVITIIGILAVGWVSVYTKQMAKARDSTRLSDIKTMQTAVETYNSENNLYPNNSSTTDWSFTITGSFSTLSKIPVDPKWTTVVCVDTGAILFSCWYKYWVDSVKINYKLGIPFEDANNNKKLDTIDSWNDDKYYEIFTDKNITL